MVARNKNPAHKKSTVVFRLRRIQISLTHMLNSHIFRGTNKCYSMTLYPLHFTKKYGVIIPNNLLSRVMGRALALWSIQQPFGKLRASRKGATTSPEGNDRVLLSSTSTLACLSYREAFLYTYGRKNTRYHTTTRCSCRTTWIWCRGRELNRRCISAFSQTRWSVFFWAYF